MVNGRPPAHMKNQRTQDGKLLSHLEWLKNILLKDNCWLPGLKIFSLSFEEKAMRPIWDRESGLMSSKD